MSDQGPTKMNEVQILTIGLDSGSEQFVRQACPGGTFLAISKVVDFELGFETWQDGQFLAIFAGNEIKEITANELAQTIQAQCPQTPRLYVTTKIEGYEPKLLIKNGFSNAFCLPQDATVMKRAIEDATASASGRKALRSIKIIDIDPAAELEFDTYVHLPMNNKYVRFSSANQPMKESKMGKLSATQNRALYVDQKDLKKFYQYSATRLQQLTQSSDAVSETERQAKLEDQVRGLFSNVFDQSIAADFEKGKETIELCQGIISNFITKGSSSDWYAKLLASVGEESDTYSHASQISTFAALFAIGLGHSNPEDLAMAGMFHDLGLIGVAPEIINKAESARTPEEKVLYEAHPEQSLQHLKKKRIVIPPTVEKAILQHHEKYSGKGFPKATPGGRISLEAQILSYADQFDYLTRLEPGKKRLSPTEAHEEIKKTLSIDPEILKKLGRVLSEQNQSKSA